MPRDHAVEAQRASILRHELARTRARLDQALGERDDLAICLDALLGHLRGRRTLSATAAHRPLCDLEAVTGPSGRTNQTTPTPKGQPRRA